MNKFNAIGIDKKELFKILSENSSAILVAPRRQEKIDDKIVNYIKSLFIDKEFINNLSFRTAEKITSNRIYFNNNSCYEIASGENKYFYIEYCNNKFIVIRNRYFDEWDQDYFYNYIVYLIK